MNREELLKIAKPILFNTEMVQAILEGRKTVTRRKIDRDITNFCDVDVDGKLLHYQNCYGDFINPVNLCRYKAGDILYVRETWGNWSYDNQESNAVYYQYRADYPSGAKTYMYDEAHECDLPKWHPSIHMPKEAARIFLKVTDVRVERLQYITYSETEKEGIKGYDIEDSLEKQIDDYVRACNKFVDIWDSTIKKQDFDKYSWEANPWVWVIEFERVEVN